MGKTPKQRTYKESYDHYFHGDEFDAYTPKLLSRVTQALLDEEKPPEPTPPAP